MRRIILTVVIVYAFGLQAWGQAFYGMGKSGGATGGGVIFKTGLDGTGYSVEYEFSIPHSQGAYADYGQLLELADGKLYGVTPYGGQTNQGVLFSYDPVANFYQKLIDFNVPSVGLNPIGRLSLAPNGKLYGTASNGGVNYNGSIFEFDPVAGTIVKKADFLKAVTGSAVFGGLALAPNGKFYGTTHEGGANSVGVLYEYDYVNNILTKRIDFDGTSKGGGPLRELLLFTPTNKLYGTTLFGGTESDGVIFEYDPSTNTLTAVFNFSDNALTTGKNPIGSLMEHSGKMYGTTSGGGVNGYGTIFQFDGSFAFAKLHDFDGVDGVGALNVLTVAGGKLYGTSEGGGSSGQGTLFELNLAGPTVTKHFDFGTTSDGHVPKSGLTLAANGKFYGTTTYGAAGNSGSIFEFDPGTNTLVKKRDINVALLGSGPVASSMVQLDNGKLYGVTSGGGSHGLGTLFEFDPITKIHTLRGDFDGGTAGANPESGLVLHPNGKLYGTAIGGGASWSGTLFEYDPALNVFTTKVDFNDPAMGRLPKGGLTLGPDGNFYGMTVLGGASDIGVIFQYDPVTDIFTKMVDFNGANGRQPNGALMLANNGLMYGVSVVGGTDNQGVLFEYIPGGALTAKKDFKDLITGSYPVGTLVEGADGKFYGMTTGGGDFGSGTVFSYNPLGDVITKLQSFNSPIHGNNVQTALARGAGNKLYGMATYGGSNGYGTLFEFDASTNQLTTKHHFAGATGIYAQYGALTKVAIPPVVSSFLPASAPVGATVTITGQNFSTTPANNVVRFGPVRATVSTATPTQLTVVVPHGAELGPITVTASNLTGRSRTSFNPTYTFNGWIPGSFYSRTDLPGATGDKRSLVADLDGDGLSEAIQVSEGSSSVHVFRNTSSSSAISFQAKMDFPLPSNGAYSIAVEDLDGDGKLDIAVASPGSNGLSILRNTSTTGSISFEPHVDLVIPGSGLISIAIADFDSDGKPDLVGGGATSIHIFKNLSVEGSLAFAGEVSFSGEVPGATIWKIAVGDIDGDHNLDIAIPVPGVTMAASNVAVFRNSGIKGTIDNASFATPVQFSAPGYTAGVELGDLNGDGKPELVVGSSTDFNSLLVRLNTATPGVIDAGTFGPAIALGTPKQVWDPKIADVDGDGKPEILCGITSNGTILIYKNLITTGAISASSFSRYSIVTEAAPLSINVADMNNDGFPDLIVGNESSNRISIFKNGNVMPPPTIASFAPLFGAVGSSITITGTNFSSTPAFNSVYFGTTMATVTAATTSSLTVTVPSGAANAPISVAVNGQITYSPKSFSPAFVTSGTITAGSFAPKTDIVAGTNPQIFSVGDFDVDGKTDVAVANIDANSMAVMRNTSTVGSISLGKVDFATGLQPYGLASADIDGDGKLDIGVANINGDHISLFRNTSTSGTIAASSFAAKVDLNTAGDAFSIAMADMDQDGRVDQVVTNLNTASLVIFKNIAGQLPYTMSTTVPGLMPSHVSLGDLDGDRMPEIVVCNIQTGSTSISIFRNRNEVGSLAWDLFEKTDITVGGTPYSATLIDLDGDGKLDIVAANNAGGTVSVLKNKITAPGPIAASSFADKVDFLVGTGPNLVTAFDVDGDLMPDIITSNDGSASVSVLKNLITTGSDVTASSFQAKVDFTVGAAPKDVHVADMDGDGKPEILATSATTNSISILRNISTLAAPVINAADQFTSAGFRLVWTAAAGAVDYRVDISSDNFVTMVPGYNNLVAPGTSLTATGLLSGTSYKFRVRSANTTGVSPNSVETIVLTLPAPPVISPTEEITTTGFKIVWATAVGAASYRVDISTDNFVTMVTGYDNVTIPVTSVVVAGLSPGTSYKFRVRAVNASGISANSAEITVITVPAAPVAAAASAITQTGFTASWAASTGAAEYRVDVSADDFATNLSGFNNLLVTGLSQAVTGLTAGTTYKYRVRAANASGVSVDSNLISVATSPSVPTITSFGPQFGNIGAIVNLTGTNFDPVLANNVVRFNGTQATVTSDATTTSINAIVPTGATTGKITITVAGQVGTSATDFVVDTTPPLIQNNTATSANKDAALTITATITDVESGITAYTLAYAALSSSAPLTAGTLMKSGTTYTGSIPSTSIGENGVEYVLTATNGAGLVTTVTATAQVGIAGDGLNIPYTSFGSDQNDYRIIAVPLDLTNKTVADVFEDDLTKSTRKNWRITKYGAIADTELTSQSLIEPKQGYWLIVKDPVAAIDTGPGKTVAASRATLVEIPLVAGWNQIGNPFNFNIVWSEVMSASPGVSLIGSPRIYRGNWADGSIINAMEGLFVNSQGAQVLKIPVQKNTSVNGGRSMGSDLVLRAIDEAGWRVYLELNQGKGRNLISGVGMERDASVGSDSHDGLTMPRFFERYLEVNHSKKRDEDPYSMDIVPTAASHVWEFEVATNYDDELLTFEWDNRSFGENDKTLVLWDEQLQLGIDMRTTSRHEFRKSGSMKFKVFFGDQDQVNDLAIAERLVFHEVYPNPAENDATVSFSVPQTGDVTFDVFDALGRRVWSQSGAYPRGRHEVGLSGIKTSAGAGLFIIQVSSDGSRQQKRLQIR